MKLTLPFVCASICAVCAVAMLICVSVAFGLAYSFKPTAVDKMSECDMTVNNTPVFPLNRPPESCMSHDGWTDGATLFESLTGSGCSLYEANPSRCELELEYASFERFESSLLGVKSREACCACGGGTEKIMNAHAPAEEMVLHAYHLQPSECIFAVDDYAEAGGGWRGLGHFDPNDWTLSNDISSFFMEQCGATDLSAVMSTRCLGEEDTLLKAYYMANDRLINRHPNVSTRLSRNISWTIGFCSDSAFDRVPLDKFVVTPATRHHRPTNLEWTSIPLPKSTRRQIITLVTTSVPLVGRAVVQSTVNGRPTAHIGTNNSAAWAHTAVDPPACQTTQWLCTVFHGSFCAENTVRVRQCANHSVSRDPLGVRRCRNHEQGPGFCVNAHEYVQLRDMWGDGWDAGYIHCRRSNETLHANLTSESLELYSEMCPSDG